MSDAQIFQVANTAALLCWIALVLLPRRVAPVARFIVPAVLGVLYIWAINTAPENPDGGFGSLMQVKALFSQDRVLLAGWVHYLAFDFFIGCWMVLDAAERGVRYPLVVPCLFLTFMFGPAGLLLYLAFRAGTARLTKSTTAT